MFRLVTFLGLLMLMLLAVNCERPVDLNFEEPEPSLVVISNFTNDQDIQVHVSKSRSILNPSEIEYVLDANVEIYNGDTFLETLELVTSAGKFPPYYTTRDLVPEEKTTYLIKVEADGFEPVMAQSHIPDKITLNSLEITDLQVVNISPDSIRFSYDFNLSFLDPGEEQNYYHLNLYQQIHLYTSQEADTMIQESILKQINFNFLEETNFVTPYFGGGILLEDDPFNGEIKNYSFPIVVELDITRELLGKVFVELRAVSADYYLYHNSLSRQQRNPNQPFSEPVIIYDNIENGKGIFAGYSFSVDSLQVLY